jgi:hypothetical protein
VDVPRVNTCGTVLACTAMISALNWAKRHWSPAGTGEYDTPPLETLVQPKLVLSMT